MPYTRGLLREAMRLYPVAPFLTRLMPNTALKVQQHGVGHLKYFNLILNTDLLLFSLGHTWCPLVPSCCSMDNTPEKLHVLPGDTVVREESLSKFDSKNFLQGCKKLKRDLNLQNIKEGFRR